MGADFPRSVTIYGTGLMGSSFALAVKDCVPGVRVFGMDKPDILRRACELGIVEPGPPVDSGLTDLTVLAAPVGEIIRILDELSPHLRLVLDLGSTKVTICQKAEQRSLRFVGGHPMTGTERSGPEAATADLLKSATFFLCPVSTTPAGSLPQLEHLIRAMGATPRVIQAEEHDRLVAKVSHLPQVLSTLLADRTAEHRALAGPGLKSLTRLAGSPFHIWRDILTTSEHLPEELRGFIEQLNFVLNALEGDGQRGSAIDSMQELEAIFERANRSISGDTRE